MKGAVPPVAVELPPKIAPPKTAEPELAAKYEVMVIANIDAGLGPQVL